MPLSSGMWGVVAMCGKRIGSMKAVLLKTHSRDLVFMVFSLLTFDHVNAIFLGCVCVFPNTKDPHY